jgi:hypothetical protein
MAVAAAIKHSVPRQREGDGKDRGTVNASTTRDHFLKRFDFLKERELLGGEGVRCSGARQCSGVPTFVIGWTYEQRINGELKELVARRPSCERHTRLFAFKHDLKIPRTKA